MTVHYGKRTKYNDASIFDVPTEVLLESIDPLLSDIDLHNLGEAAGGRIKEHASSQVQLGVYIDVYIDNTFFRILIIIENFEYNDTII